MTLLIKLRLFAFREEFVLFILVIFLEVLFNMLLTSCFSPFFPPQNRSTQPPFYMIPVLMKNYRQALSSQRAWVSLCEHHKCVGPCAKIRSRASLHSVWWFHIGIWPQSEVTMKQEDKATGKWKVGRISAQLHEKLAVKDVFLLRLSGQQTMIKIS